MKPVTFRLSLILIIIAIPLSLRGETVTEDWVVRYNGPGNDSDIAQTIATDRDNNIYITGNSFGTGTGSDIATIKYDPNGNELWVVRFNGPSDGDDFVGEMVVDDLGNVYVAGYTNINTNDDDFVTVKYDSNGNELWIARYNGPGSGNFSHDFARDIEVDTFGNVYVAGSVDSATNKDFTTIKYDANGNELWAARYNGPGNGNDEVRSMTINNSGNVVVTGSSWGLNNVFDDIATVKYDTNGNELWAARYDGPGNGNDYSKDIIIDSFGNIYVAGGSNGGVTNDDITVIKYSPNGIELWVDRYDGTAHLMDTAYALTQDSSGNLYVAGMAQLTRYIPNFTTIKYDTDGNRIWLVHSELQDSIAEDIAVDILGNVYTCGRVQGPVSGVDILTIKYDPNGNELWTARYNGPDNLLDRSNSLVLSENGNVYVTGENGGNGTSEDYVTIKYNSGPDSYYCYFPAIKDGSQTDGLWKNYLSICAVDPSVTLQQNIKGFDSDGNVIFSKDEYTPINGCLVKTPNWLACPDALDCMQFNGTIIVQASAPITCMTNTIAPKIEAFNIYESPVPRNNLFFPAGYDNNADSYVNSIHIQNTTFTPVNINVEFDDDSGGIVQERYLIPSYGKYEKVIRNAVGGDFNGTISVQASGDVAGVLRYEKMAGSTVEAMNIYEPTIERKELYYPYLYDGQSDYNNYISTMNTSISDMQCTYNYYRNDGTLYYTSIPLQIAVDTRNTITPCWIMDGNLACDQENEATGLPWIGEFEGSMIGNCTGNAVSTTNVIKLANVEGLNFHESTRPMQKMIFPQVYEEEGYSNTLHLLNPNPTSITVILSLNYLDGTQLGQVSQVIPGYGKYITQPNTINGTVLPTNGSLTVDATPNTATGVMVYEQPTMITVYEGVEQR